MLPLEPPLRRTRLAPWTIEPFVRATSVDDVSVYWLPVNEFPILPRQREWLLEFHKQLAANLSKRDKLREECFLQVKVLYPDLLNSFSEKSQRYVPLPGGSLTPGTRLPEAPSFASVKEGVEEAARTGKPLDVHQWMPDYMHWFLMKYPEQQREDFLGHGGMLTLYLAPDANAAAPVMEIPQLFRSMPCYSDDDQKQMQALYSMQDRFLAQSKEVFGNPFRGDPNFPGLMFTLPLFTSGSLLQSTQDERKRWFGVFDGYFIESRPDKGMLLALKNPQFDETLEGIVGNMRKDGLVYRTTS